MYERKVINLLNRLTIKGYECYLVGGVVRDNYLGRDCHDYDATTNATPEQIKETFNDLCIFSYGEKFGTVAIKYDEFLIEITTFRTDEVYTDNRHPSSLSFGTTLKEDVTRRDFTCNALAYDVKNDKLIDLVGGISDIDNKIIRTVGIPKQRFLEDGLRILRCIRFASTLSFSIEKETEEAISACLPCLDNISRERITEEIFKMLVGDFNFVYNRFFYCFKYLIPSLDKSNINLFKIDLEDGYKLTFRLFFLSLNSKNPRDVIEYFKCEKKIKQRVYNLLSNINTKVVDDVSKVRLLMFKMGIESFKDLNYFKQIMNNKYASITTINEAISLGVSLKDLDINGNDIKNNLNVDSKDINKLLEEAFNAVALNKVENKKEELINYLKNN